MYILNSDNAVAFIKLLFMRDMVTAAGLPVIGMETSLNKVMPANINRRLFDGSSAIDMVVSDAGTLKCFDQSIIMIGRGDDKTTCLSARRNAKIKKYEAALKLGSIQFAPIIVSLLGA